MSECRNRAKNSKWKVEDKDAALEKIQVFKIWWAKHIWKVNEDGDYTIMIIPQGRPGANYRVRVLQSS